MPLSDLEKKTTGLTFDIAAEEMRRLKGTPTDSEKLRLYGLYKQAVHGDAPPQYLMGLDDADDQARRKYFSWQDMRGRSEEYCKEAYVRLAEEMIAKYGRTVIRCKWNSEVWSVDY